jgi:hypothetical protein
MFFFFFFFFCVHSQFVAPSNFCHKFIYAFLEMKARNVVTQRSGQNHAVALEVLVLSFSFIARDFGSYVVFCSARSKRSEQFVTLKREGHIVRAQQRWVQAQHHLTPRALVMIIRRIVNRMIMTTIMRMLLTIIMMRKNARMRKRVISVRDLCCINVIPQRHHLLTTLLPKLRKVRAHTMVFLLHT